MNELMTEVFVENPLALPGSAKKWLGKISKSIRANIYFDILFIARFVYISNLFGFYLNYRHNVTGLFF